MKGTRIVITALTSKGKETLKVQMNDELALRAKYKGVPTWQRPVNLRKYLRTVSLFVPKDDPVRHEILGFGLMSADARNSFYFGVKSAFLENGCSVNDFEVRFVDK